MKDREDAKKIPTDLENPLDTITYNMAYETNKIFKALGFTPNILTTLSLAFTIFGILKLYQENYKLAIIFIYIGYYFDCSDGIFARTYDMKTDFGDKYDHMSDSLKILFLTVWFWNENNIDKKIKSYFGALFLFLGFFVLMQFGCQEKNNRDKQDVNVLGVLKKLCKDQDSIKYTRYLGGGTFILVFCVFLYNIEKLT